MRRNMLAAALLLLNFVLPIAVVAEDQSSGDPQFATHRNSTESEGGAAARERQMQRARAKERTEKIKHDAEKLLELATELKQYVDRTGEDVVSLDVIRKAEQMEKIARDLKNRMKSE